MEARHENELMSTALLWNSDKHKGKYINEGKTDICGFRFKDQSDS